MVDDDAVATFATTLFEKLDKDNSGSVEIKEMKFFLRKVVGLGDKDECRKVATAMMHLANDGGLFCCVANGESMWYCNTRVPKAISFVGALSIDWLKWCPHRPGLKARLC